MIHLKSSKKMFFFLGKHLIMIYIYIKSWIKKYIYKPFIYYKIKTKMYHQSKMPIYTNILRAINLVAYVCITFIKYIIPSCLLFIFLWKHLHFIIARRKSNESLIVTISFFFSFFWEMVTIYLKIFLIIPSYFKFKIYFESWKRRP